MKMMVSMMAKMMDEKRGVLICNLCYLISSWLRFLFNEGADDDRKADAAVNVGFSLPLWYGTVK